jgi:hypothetical protein
MPRLLTICFAVLALVFTNFAQAAFAQEVRESGLSGTSADDTRYDTMPAGGQPDMSEFVESFFASVPESPPSPDVTPGTLYGEQISDSPLDSVQVTPEHCGGSAGNTTFTFQASGVATGPYPGTFEATATYVIGPHAPFQTSPIVSYSETFTIHSGETTITGTKEIATGDTSPYTQNSSGQCQEFNNIFGQHGRIVVGSALMRYHATIVHGPTKTEDCQNGGWKNYPTFMFKNQGDCVSYVNSHKNKPK